tara:strand:+ start:160 stop:612 length:453 start_codon:yes stop_codon:yes gene_type:complete
MERPAPAATAEMVVTGMETFLLDLVCSELLQVPPVVELEAIMVLAAVPALMVVEEAVAVNLMLGKLLLVVQVVLVVLVVQVVVMVAPLPPVAARPQPGVCMYYLPLPRMLVCQVVLAEEAVAGEVMPPVLGMAVVALVVHLVFLHLQQVI